MNWYYIINGEQQGPVSEEVLMSVIGNDSNGASLMIWKEGLPEWVLAGSVFPDPKPPVLVPPPMPKGFVAMGVCCECGRSFPANDMVALQGQSLCVQCQPIAVQKIKEGLVMGTTQATGGTYRDGKLVLTMDKARLPGRCVKCNVATDDRVRRKLTWLHPAYLLLLFLGVIMGVGFIIYVIVSLIVRKKATIEVGFCERHRNRRRLDIFCGWFGMIFGTVLIAGCLSSQNLEGAAAGIFLIFASFIYLFIRSDIVTPKRIDEDGRVWLKGACREYLDSLPSTNG